MKLTESFYRSKLPAVLVAGLSLSCVALTAQESPILSGPASVNAIAISVSPNPAKVKGKITMTATVTTNNKAATGGTVTFLDGKAPLGSAQVVGKKPAKGYKAGTATLTLIVSPGSHSVTAVYGGT